MADESAHRTIKAFLSYKWESDTHNAWVRKFAADLRAHGIEAILDQFEVAYGESLTDYMQRHINDADVILFVITPGAVAAAEAPKGEGGALKFEVQMMNARRIAEGTRIVGIFRSGNRPPNYLRDHRYADFRDDDRYPLELENLVQDLLGRRSRPPVMPPAASGTKEKQTSNNERSSRPGVQSATSPSGQRNEAVAERIVGSTTRQPQAQTRGRPQWVAILIGTGVLLVIVIGMWGRDYRPLAPFAKETQEPTKPRPQVQVQPQRSSQPSHNESPQAAATEELHTKTHKPPVEQEPPKSVEGAPDAHVRPQQDPVKTAPPVPPEDTVAKTPRTSPPTQSPHVDFESLGFFARTLVTRASVDTIRSFDGYNAWSAAVVDEADATSAINLVLHHQVGLFSQHELDTIGTLLHMSEVQRRLQATSTLPLKERLVAADHLVGLFLHFFVLTSNRESTAQLYNLFRQYIAGPPMPDGDPGFGMGPGPLITALRVASGMCKQEIDRGLPCPAFSPSTT
jgi:hypothetical protein